MNRKIVFGAIRLGSIGLLNPKFSKIIECDSMNGWKISLSIEKIKVSPASFLILCLLKLLGEFALWEQTRHPQQLPNPLRKFCYTIAWKSTPASTRALEIWADCWKWTLSAGRERNRKIADSHCSFWIPKGGKGTRKEDLLSSRTQHPI